MKLKICLIFLVLFPNSIKSTTFENVTVLLTTQLNKLFLQGAPPIARIYIKSSDTLAKYVNFQPLEIVTIRNEHIPVLRENSVANLPSIVHLSIISSKTRVIEPGTFQNIPKLDGLSLEGNLIEEIRTGVFTGLTVQTLYLNNNKISRIEKEAFNNMTLTFISLDNNRISSWDSNWFKGTPLGAIYMKNNLLEELPANAFDYAYRFKKINVPLALWYVVLSHNRIRTIDEEAFKHINAIGYLNLDGNSLSELPVGVFRSVKNINTLDLRDNDIRNVDGVFNNINIHQLILFNNTLNCFPKEAFDISRINFVFLDGNRLSCTCVKMWKDYQVQQNVQVLYNMKRLENDCVEMYPKTDKNNLYS